MKAILLAGGWTWWQTQQQTKAAPVYVTEALKKGDITDISPTLYIRHRQKQSAIVCSPLIHFRYICSACLLLF